MSILDIPGNPNLENVLNTYKYNNSNNINYTSINNFNNINNNSNFNNLSNYAYNKREVVNNIIYKKLHDKKSKRNMYASLVLLCSNK